MNAATITTVLTSAVVSAFVALAIEWAAKPRLEARKERILAVQRARFAAIDACREILMRLGGITTRNPFARSPEREKFIAEMTRMRSEIVDLSRTLQDHLVVSGIHQSALGRELYGRLVGRVRGAAISEKTNDQVVEELTGPVLLLAHLLETQRGKPIGRWVAKRNARAWLAEQASADTRPALEEDAVTT
ncbi:hypothetical protein [Nonomuraea sp. NPDC003804]|uniref:hypothetical protein n=1 Tax=Nonomuraea sp. NPDC003804 TaxID=3154547 RepID=UPI0033AF91A9